MEQFGQTLTRDKMTRKEQKTTDKIAHKYRTNSTIIFKMLHTKTKRD